MSSQELETEDVGDVAVVRITAPRLENEDHIRAVFQEVAGLVDAGRPNLLLNLGRVEFLASVAVGKLLTLHRKVQSAGGRLALCQLSSATDEVLEIMHLKQVIPVYDDEQEALRSF
jgi:anti-sigma B factor antagonist